MRHKLHDYGLGFFLLAMFLLSWLGQWLTHAGTTSDFWNATFENWQSEFLQLFAMVVATAYLIFRNSPQSRDGSDRVEEALKVMDQRLSRIESTLTRATRI
jgi:membrane protein implicated in regulation of membrane protease activity